MKTKMPLCVRCMSSQRGSKCRLIVVQLWISYPKATLETHLLVQPTSHSRCGTKTETLDEIMDLTTFGSRSNVRQIGCYICPGCKDVKCVTNMLSYLSLINARQILFEYEAIFHSRTNIRQNRQMCSTSYEPYFTPWRRFFTRVPPCMIYSVSLLCISREITLIWALFIWIKSVIFTKTGWILVEARTRNCVTWPVQAIQLPELTVNFCGTVSISLVKTEANVPH